MKSRQHHAPSPRALRIEDLEQRRLLVASLDVQASINTVDADSPPGIVLESGATANLTYRVTNTGNEALTDVVVVDDNGTTSPEDDIVALPNLTTQQAQGLSLGVHGLGLAYGFLMHPTRPLMFAGIKGNQFGENKLLIFNTETLALSTVHLQYLEAKYLALSNGGTHLYLGGTGGTFSVPVMDVATGAMLPEVPGWAYNGLNVGSDGRLLIHAISKIDQVDPQDGEEVAPPITLPGNDLYYGTSLISPDKTRLYYLSEAPVRSTFNQFDLTTEPPTRLWRLETDSVGEDIALTSDGAYVSIITDVNIEGIAGVPKYRTSDMALVGSFNTGGRAREIVYSPDGQVAYIVSEAGKVGIWDANTFQKLGDISVTGGDPVEMQVDASGKYLFVTVDGATDSVQIYSTGRNGVHNVGDKNANRKLDPGEAWSFHATTTAQPGPHMHVATAKAVTNATIEISDSDPSHYLVYTTWEGTASVAENLSGAAVGPLPTYPWSGPWTISDSRFEIASGNNLRLKAGQSLSAAEDDGAVVEVWTTQANPFLVARFSLEVSANALPWHNPAEPRDVDGDGHIVPQDALIIINHLHFNQNNPSARLGPRPASVGQLIDVNGDGYLTAVDALTIINWLHLNPSVPDGPANLRGEGEGAPANHDASLALLLSEEEETPSSPAIASRDESSLHLPNAAAAMAAVDLLFTAPAPQQAGGPARRLSSDASSDAAAWWPSDDDEENELAFWP